MIDVVLDVVMNHDEVTGEGGVEAPDIPTIGGGLWNLEI